MMVFINSRQLRPIIERTIVDLLKIHPMNIMLDTRYHTMNQPSWEIGVEFDHNDDHHFIQFTIDPMTGFVQSVELQPKASPLLHG